MMFASAEPKITTCGGLRALPKNGHGERDWFLALRCSHIFGSYWETEFSCIKTYEAYEVPTGTRGRDLREMSGAHECPYQQTVLALVLAALAMELADGKEAKSELEVKGDVKGELPLLDAALDIAASLGLPPSGGSSSSAEGSRASLPHAWVARVQDVVEAVDIGEEDSEIELKKLDQAAMRLKIQDMQDFWTPPPHPRDFRAWCLGRFGVLTGEAERPMDSEGLKALYDDYGLLMARAHKLYMVALHKGMVGRDPDGKQAAAKQDLGQAFARIYEVMSHCYCFADSEQRARLVMDAAQSSLFTPAEVHILRASPFRLDTLKPYAKWMIFLLCSAFHQGLRRYRGACWQRIPLAADAHQVGAAGADTHAWSPQLTIQEFITRTTDKRRFVEHWATMNDGANLVRAESYLQVCTEDEFPPLKPDRHVFSFRNGVYMAREKKLYRYRCLDEAATLPSSLVACKYFDCEFPEAPTPRGDWRALATPAFHSILTQQHLPPDVCDWVYIFMGRLLYDTNELDNWQVMLFIKGIAGSGKSTIGLFVRQFYDASDVANMAANMEEKFGLSAIVDKFMFICFEAMEKMGINQADMQSIITGEQMMIAIKNKLAQTRTWVTPGLFLGNYVPSWIDSAGSMSRRTCLLEFNHKVGKVDTQLPRRLNAELAVFLRKCNEAYLWAVEQYGSRDVWADGVLPDYFHKTRHRMEIHMNPLSSFIFSSDKIVHSDPDRFVSWKLFYKAFRDWAREENVRCGKMDLHSAVTSSTFVQLGVVRCPLKYHWRGRLEDNECLRGLGLKEQSPDYPHDGYLSRINVDGPAAADADGPPELPPRPAPRPPRPSGPRPASVRR